MRALVKVVLTSDTNGLIHGIMKTSRWRGWYILGFHFVWPVDAILIARSVFVLKPVVIFAIWDLVPTFPRCYVPYCGRPHYSIQIRLRPGPRKGDSRDVLIHCASPCVDLPSR
jgi:hypothetical protein